MNPVRDVLIEEILRLEEKQRIGTHLVPKRIAHLKKILESLDPPGKNSVDQKS